MATGVNRHRRDRRFDNFFFSGMARSLHVLTSAILGSSPSNLPGKRAGRLLRDERYEDPEAAAWASMGWGFLCLRSSHRKLSVVKSVLR